MFLCHQFCIWCAMSSCVVTWKHTLNLRVELLYYIRNKVSATSQRITINVNSVINHPCDTFAVTKTLATYDTKKNDDKIWGTKKPYRFPQSFVFFSSQTFHQQAHTQISNLTENTDSFDFNFELYVQS